MNKVGRNDPCPCGSGKKHKQCCLASARSETNAAPASTQSGAAFDRALECFQAGQLQEARQLCQQLLQAQPKHADGWHLLGVIEYEHRQFDASVAAIHSAVGIEPANASYHNTLGVVLTAANDYDAAIASCQRALALHGTYAEAHYNLGKAYHCQGNLEKALASYRQALVHQPGYVLAYSSSADILQTQGKLELAIAQYGKALELKPNFAEAHNNLGNVLRTQEKFIEATACYRRALKLKPQFSAALNNLGAVLQAQGSYDEALLSYHQALNHAPAFAAAHCNLGSLLQSQDKLTDALASYELALLFDSECADAYCNLGKMLQDRGDIERAIVRYRRALEIDAGHVAALSHLAGILREQERVEAAIAIYKQALVAQPNSHFIHAGLAAVLKDSGRLDEASTSYRHALTSNSNFAEAHNNLGAILQLQGDLPAAIASFLNAIACKPDYALAHSNLGTAYKQQGRLDDALGCYRLALQCQPDYAEAHSNIGTVLELQGHVEAAVSSYQRALAIDPALTAAFSNWLFVRAYQNAGAEETLAHARRWELNCVPEDARILARQRDFVVEPLGGRRLRVGYVSGDFRRHPVSCFVEHLFAQHDRSRLEVFAYATTSEFDVVTERIKNSVEHWRPLLERDDAVLRDRIAADRIDVLIDLSGHTAGNRLAVFARRAAPVQAHYLGFFGTTGLSEMDYWIGDEVLTPNSVAGSFCEQILRLPRVSVSYAGDTQAPESAWQPNSDGTLCIGTFNNLIKLNDTTLRLWSRILKALPEACLLLKTQHLADAGNRQRILSALTALGIAPERIQLRDSHETHNWLAHMAYYDRLDIALDPVSSWGGNTTTCDALWMSVPVITLQGEHMPTRMTASMLCALGHPEWVAQSEQEYVDKVVALARDVELRKKLRSTQRSKMAANSLCSARALASSLETAYTQMYERWCANQQHVKQAAA